MKGVRLLCTLIQGQLQPYHPISCGKSKQIARGSLIKELRVTSVAHIKNFGLDKEETNSCRLRRLLCSHCPFLCSWNGKHSSQSLHSSYGTVCLSASTRGSGKPHVPCTVQRNTPAVSDAPGRPVRKTQRIIAPYNPPASSIFDCVKHHLNCEAAVIIPKAPRRLCTYLEDMIMLRTTKSFIQES